MSVTIELPPEIEAGLTAQAEAQGLALTKYLEHVLETQVLQPSPGALSPSERAALWRESVKDLPRTPPLSDEAISREHLYDERG
jgi:hypothetical protein